MRGYRARVWALCCVCAPSRPGLSRRVLPTKADTLPSGGLWIHEIKHDGFRIIARKDGERVTLYSRPGNDFTRRFPPIARALTHLRCRSCIIDGEAVVCDDNGVTSDHIRYRPDGDVFLYAFDLIELNGDDLRRDSLDVRKATLRFIVVSTLTLATIPLAFLLKDPRHTASV
jgi:bifunctional non-homologous end joining protein LigD